MCGDPVRMGTAGELDWQEAVTPEIFDLECRVHAPEAEMRVQTVRVFRHRLEKIGENEALLDKFYFDTLLADEGHRVI